MVLVSDMHVDAKLVASAKISFNLQYLKTLLAEKQCCTVLLVHQEFSFNSYTTSRRRLARKRLVGAAICTRADRTFSCPNCERGKEFVMLGCCASFFTHT